MTRITLGVILAAMIAAVPRAQSQDGFRFKSGVELVNVTATVTDDNGRFASGLEMDDFKVFEDGVAQDITHFSNERVPVSLGILLDSSGSMTDEKMASARSAIDRFIFDLLGPDDELFFAEFSSRSLVRQTWTTDRRAISRAVSRVRPSGGTALYDAVADTISLAEEGRNRKKALLLISDGNDTNSQLRVEEVRAMIRETEVLVYALGVDGTSTSTRVSPPRVQIPLPLPFPLPLPGGRRTGRTQPPIGGGGIFVQNVDRVNPEALRQITDDTGGRTEIVRGFGDLEDATARIADELSRQYYLGYTSTGKQDGRWHSIRVEVGDRRLNVRARRGYVAS